MAKERQDGGGVRVREEERRAQFVNRIFVGHVIEKLRELPDECVQMCVTSPPYYGLRTYKIAPQVWGGDQSCAHEFAVEKTIGEIGNGNWSQGTNGRGELQPGGVEVKRRAIKAEIERGLCIRCGAWRGHLGNEEVLDCAGWAVGSRCARCYICHIVDVFREVRRILRDDGCLLLNLGDSFAAASAPSGLKQKDLMGVPWRAAFALQADGWWLRNEHIWEKGSAMPESCVDRCTRSHEQVFHFAKSGRYYWDAFAIHEPASEATHARVAQAVLAGRAGGFKQNETSEVFPGRKSRERCPEEVLRSIELRAGITPKSLAAAHGTKNNPSFSASVVAPVLTRNKRTVWTINPEPNDWEMCEACGRVFSGEDKKRIRRSGDKRSCPCGRSDAWVGHFAAFPEALVEPCVLAASSERGACSECGSPWRRVTERQSTDEVKDYAGKNAETDKQSAGRRILSRVRAARENGTGTHDNPFPPPKSLGWEPTCSCGTGSLRPDDFEIVQSPTGERGGDDLTIEIGRKGYDRPRGQGEGVRPITRYEQRLYAAHLRSSPHRKTMKEETGEAFAHYIRTDRTGSRPVPAPLLEEWIGRGWLTRVEPPTRTTPTTVPCIILDPFLGSGTSALVALKSGRAFIGVELSPQYAKLAEARIAPELAQPRLL